MIASKPPRIQSMAAWQGEPALGYRYPGSFQSVVRCTRLSPTAADTLQLERHISWSYSNRSPASTEDSEKGFSSIGERSRSFQKFTADIVSKVFKLSNLEDVIRAQDLEIDDLKKELETFKEEHRIWKERANTAEESLKLSKKGNETAKLMMQDQAVKIQELEDKKNELKLAVEKLEDWRNRVKKMLKELVENLFIKRA
ncbi:eed0cff6-4fa6-429c-80f9-ba1060fa6496 [Sclerotinia trifoliorum]|uniref:Eed0cff6-4fa6-429c-80f9-ba1060fa6496 n=1 Tax=Sclerotinia trifoliorum TaxID=28548 RepID=A0A8H2VZQ4_9HELO|nr:eed0cff6-4fa6-429c-80f9-ba1060fa6496 [Sclerotinia trifoliorum]